MASGNVSGIGDQVGLADRMDQLSIDATVKGQLSADATKKDMKVNDGRSVDGAKQNTTPPECSSMDASSTGDKTRTNLNEVRCLPDRPQAEDDENDMSYPVAALSIDSINFSSGEDSEEDFTTLDIKRLSGETVRIRWHQTMPSVPYATVGGKKFPHSESSLHYMSKSLWFHGTDFEYTENILTKGIKLELGRYRMQFSDGYGFYLNHDFDQAIRWARHRNTHRPTVIVFKPTFSFKQFLGLDLTQDKNSWQDLVKYCLCDFDKRTFGFDASLIDHYHTCDYVYGPILTNRPDYRSYSDWSPMGFQNPNRQLYILSEQLAKAICRVENIDSVITFPRSGS